MRTPPALQAGDELQEDSVDPVGYARFVPLSFSGMFLAFVEEEGFHMVAGYRIARQV